MNDPAPDPANSSVTAATPTGVNLDGVESSVFAYLKEKWWIVGLFLIATIGVLFINYVLAIIVVAIGLTILRRQYENNLFGAFARSNNFSYARRGDVLGEQGIIFSVGHTKKFSDVVTGMYKNWTFHLFLYTYTVGYGKNSQTYHRGVMEVDFMTRLPAFVLRRHAFLEAIDTEGESLRAGGYNATLSLEGDFDKHFRVHIVRDTEIDVLEILTPDVMEMLIKLDKYEIEMTRAGTFYIYTRSYIDNKQDLVEIYTILQAIATKIGTYAQRQEELHPST